MQTKKTEMLLYSTLGVVVMLGIVVALNLLAGTVRTRLDLTADKTYTLSAGTRAILKKLDTPVKIRFYCTQSEAATTETVMLRKYARAVEDLLNEYKQAGGRFIVLEKLDPQPDSDAADSARLDGLEPQQLSGVDEFYLGLSFGLADARETIPFLDPSQEQLLEYEISRRISRVVNTEKPVIGVMSSLPVFGALSNPMMARMGQQATPAWTVITELQADYNVKQVGMDSDKIPDDVKVLLVIHPKGITDRAQFALDQFVLRGGKLIAFLDPTSIVDSQGQSNPMMSMGATGSNLGKLLKAWGYTFDPAKVVGDVNFKMRVNGANGQPSEAPTYLDVDERGIDPKDVVTGQLGRLWMIQAGAFVGTPVDGLTESVLVHSTEESQLVEGFIASMSGESVLQDFKPSGVNYKLVLRLTGRFKTAFPDGQPAEPVDPANPDAPKPEADKPGSFLKESAADNSVVLVGDSDMLYDPVMFRRTQTPFGTFAQPQNGNLGLAQNLSDQMAGDNNLVGIRSRAGQGRPFTRIKALEARAQTSFQSEIKRLQESSRESQQKINELQSQKQDGDQRFVLSPEQKAELDKLRKEEAATRVRLKQVQKDLRKEVVSLQTGIKWLNILAMPLAVTSTGLAIALVKRKKTSAK